MSIGRQPHQISSTALDLHHIADRLFKKSCLRRNTDYQDTILDQTDRSMLQLSCCVSLRMNITDLLHLQAAFHTDGIINSSSDKENILCICILACEPLDTLLVIQRLLYLLRECAKLFDQGCIPFLRDHILHLCRLDRQQIHCDQLGTVCLCRGNRDLRACISIKNIITFSRNAGTHYVHDTKYRNLAFFRKAECCKAVCRLTGLRDDHNQ